MPRLSGRKRRDVGGSGTRFADPFVNFDMKASVRFSRGRLTYTGHIARHAFTSWADSAEGQRLLERVASQIRFAPFGRRRASRRRVWRQLVEVARTEIVVSYVQRELDAYLLHLEELVYAPDLPRMGVELRRLVVVPRLLLNGEVYARLDRSLRVQTVFAASENGGPLRSWFILTLISGLEAALAGTRPSPWRPLPTGKDWITVGINERFQWRVPFGGTEWPGHYYVLELRRIAITRAVRKATRRAIAGLEESLASLSRLSRAAILHTAAQALERSEPRTQKQTGT